jgi:adenine-specific DNA-methyltransferase
MGKPGTKMARMQEGLTASSDRVASGYNEGMLEAFSNVLNFKSEPEDSYRTLVSIEHRKRFGQFFTPPAIARLMGEWIAAINPRSVLDPAVGPGIFPRTLNGLSFDSHITVMDIDPVALGASRLALGEFPGITYLQQDFLTWTNEQLFDAVIANPPYLRHHDVSYPFDIFDYVGKKNYVHVSRLSNIYVLFILEICRRLRKGGRAAVIVPGEWVNANFGDLLKNFLLSRGLLQTLIYFSHVSTQFEDALTTASVLLLENPVNDEPTDSVRTIFISEGYHVEGVMSALQSDEASDSQFISQTFTPERLLRERKWNHLLSHGHRQTPKGFIQLSAIADTRRGIATGCNSFFHLRLSTIKDSHLTLDNLIRCVGKATDIKSLIFHEQDFQELVDSDARCYLLNLESGLSEFEAEYIKKGELEKLPQRYLCAVHKPEWYSMERRPASAIWACVFGREGLRFVYNPDRIANLTTFHCIYPKLDSPKLAAALTACLNSRIVQNFARRQLRVYGGGLLKVEPRDLLDIEVPDLRSVSENLLEELAEHLRELDAAIRRGKGTETLIERLDLSVKRAADEAGSKFQAASEGGQFQLEVFPLLALHRRHAETDA